VGGGSGGCSPAVRGAIQKIRDVLMVAVEPSVVTITTAILPEALGGGGGMDQSIQQAASELTQAILPNFAAYLQAHPDFTAENLTRADVEAIVGKEKADEVFGRAPPSQHDAILTLLTQALRADIDSYRIQANQAKTNSSFVYIWKNSWSTGEKKTQELVGLISKVSAFIRYNLDPIISKIRSVHFINRIEKYFQHIQMNRIFLNPYAIVKILNNQTLVNRGDVIGLPYSIKNPENATIKSGSIIENTSLYFPANHSITISGVTITGTEIIAQHPDYQEFSELEDMVLHSILFGSILLFSLGFFTQMSTLMNTAIKLGKFDSNPNIERFTSIYYFFKNTFGKGFADVILGQFRDIFAYVGATSHVLLSRSKMVTEAFIKKSSSKFILFFALFFLPFFSIFLEFFQANFHIENIDVPDVLAFSIVPISIAIFVTYPLLRNFILTKMQGMTMLILTGTLAIMSFIYTSTVSQPWHIFWQGRVDAVQKNLYRFTPWLRPSVIPLETPPKPASVEVSQPFILTSDTFTFDGVPSSITYTLSDSATPHSLLLPVGLHTPMNAKSILDAIAADMKENGLPASSGTVTISYYDASGVLQQFTETFQSVPSEEASVPSEGLGGGGGSIGGGQTEQERSPAIAELQQFITNVWQHPLLTQMTIGHRKLGAELFLSFLKKNNIDPNNYVAIPVGSSVWITEDTSDHDFIVIARTENDRRILKNLNLGMLPDDISFLDTIVAQDIATDDSTKYSLIPILFTPDEYIAGSVAFAQNIRTFLITSMQISNTEITPEIQITPEMWNQNIQEIFTKYYREWAYGIDEFRASNETKRIQRLKMALAKRAKQSKMGEEEYMKQFVLALSAIHPPALDVFIDALTQTRGKLILDSQLKIQGIIEVDQQAEGTALELVLKPAAEAMADAMRKAADDLVQNNCDGAGSVSRRVPTGIPLLPNTSL
ncbi:MAG: hypothetical protein AAB457_04300, partial [Patescibacteria group bacterium]